MCSMVDDVLGGPSGSFDGAVLQPDLRDARDKNLIEHARQNVVAESRCDRLFRPAPTRLCRR